MKADLFYAFVFLHPLLTFLVKFFVGLNDFGNEAVTDDVLGGKVGDRYALKVGDYAESLLETRGLSVGKVNLRYIACDNSL